MSTQAPLFDPSKMPLRGVQLIEAAAGTGKTYTIAGLFLRLLVEAGHEVALPQQQLHVAVAGVGGRHLAEDLHRLEDPLLLEGRDPGAVERLEILGRGGRGQGQGESEEGREEPGRKPCRLRPSVLSDWSDVGPRTGRTCRTCRTSDVGLVGLVAGWAFRPDL